MSGWFADPDRHDWGNKTADVVDVAWNACGRVLKSYTRGGQPVRVLLPPGQRLHHGDVLFEDQTTAIVVNVPACELVVARPADAATAAPPATPPPPAPGGGAASRSIASQLSAPTATRRKIALNSAASTDEEPRP